MGRTPNTLNCDLYPGPNIDAAFDLQGPWPFDDSSISAVLGMHVLEHLTNPWAFFKEAWRVLAPSAEPNLILRLPYGPSGQGITDLTHVRQWTPASFCAFQPGYDKAVYNPQHSTWPAPFSVMSVYLRITPECRRLVYPLVRRWGLTILDYIWGGYEEMIVGLRALKTEDEVTRWGALNMANSVPVARCMYQNDYEGRPLREGERLRFLFFGPGAKELQAKADADNS